jgi:hypothetical protein
MPSGKKSDELTKKTSEEIVLGVHLRRPKSRTPLCVKEAKRGV